MVNHRIKNLQWSLVRDKLKMGMALPQVKFSYNTSWDHTNQLSPFEIVYKQPFWSAWINTYSSYQTIEYPSWRCHEQVEKTIIDNNAKYEALTDTHSRREVFEVGHFIWVVLTYKRFLVCMYNKLKKIKIRPCEVLQKINNNA